MIIASQHSEAVAGDQEGVNAKGKSWWWWSSTHALAVAGDAYNLQPTPTTNPYNAIQPDLQPTTQRNNVDFKGLFFGSYFLVLVVGSIGCHVVSLGEYNLTTPRRPLVVSCSCMGLQPDNLG